MSTCHRGLGAKVATSWEMRFARSPLNSSSATARYSRSSLASVSMFFSFTRLYTNCRALRRIVTSLSLTHSTIVCLCLCTACASRCTTLLRAFRATYRALLSRPARNRPRMFTAKTRKPPMLSTPTMALTASYRIAHPAFFEPSVFEATFARTSDI